MSRKRIFFSGIGIVGFVLFLAGCFFSPLGVGLTRKAINLFAGESIHIGNSAGSYADEFSFTDISFGKEDGTLKKLAIAWQPLALFRGEAHFKKIELDGFYFKSSRDAKQPAQNSEPSENFFNFSRIVSFFRLVVDEFLVKDFFYDRGVDEDGDPQTSFRFDTIVIEVVADSSGVKLKRLQADGPDMAADIHGFAALNKDWHLDLAGDFRFAGFGFHSMAGDFSVSGPSALLDVRVSLDAPGELRLNGKLSNLFKQPAWKAELLAEDFDLSLWIKNCPQIIVERASALMQGDFSHYQGHALFYGFWQEFDRLRLEGDLFGNGSFIDFATLSLRRDNAILVADGARISWENIFDWRGKIVAKNIDPSLFDSSFQGRFDTVFDTRGEVFPEDVKARFDIVSLDGKLHDQPVSAVGELVVDENGIKTSRFELKSGNIEGTAIVGPAEINWSEQPGWTARIVLNKFDPGFFSPHFAGQIDGELNSHGQFATDTDPFSVTLAIKELAGRLRGQHLSGSGSFSFQNGLFSTEGLHLALGDSRLSLHKGEIAAEKTTARNISLSVDFYSPSLDDIHPAAEGELDLSVRLKGTLQQPEVAVSLAGSGLQWQENSFEKAEGNFQVQWWHNGYLNGNFHGSGFSRGEIVMRQLSLQLSGDMDAHQIVIKTDNAVTGSIPFSAAGTFVGRAQPEKMRWVGRFINGNVVSKKYGNWQQQDEAVLELTPDTLLIENMLFGSEWGRISALFTAERKTDDQSFQWNTNLSVDNINFRKITELADLPVDIDGEFATTFTLDGVDSVVNSGILEISLPKAIFDLSSLSTQSRPIELYNGQVLGVFEDGALKLDGQCFERSGGEMELNLRLVELDDEVLVAAGELPLSGTISFEGFDVGILANLFSYSQPFGKLHSALLIGGTFFRPSFSGKISLDGGIGLLSQGISLKNPEIKLEGEKDRMRFWARAASGDGFIDISGQLNYDDLKSFGRIDIGGENFLVVDQPEYSFVANPDMIFRFNNREGHLTGNIDVISGIIEPDNFTEMVSLSEDVVLVEKGKDAVPGWLFFMDVNVNIDNGVTVDGYGLKGELAGALAIKMTPQELLSGYGTLKLRNGKFSMYGRSLDISRGNIIFSGGPVDNPGVDVRAEISMSEERSLGEGYTVGVDVSGLASNLQYRLFSTPPMGDTEILSYMILGHSLAGKNAGDESVLAAAADKLGLTGGTVLFGKLGDLLTLDDVHIEGSVVKDDLSLVVGKRLTKEIYVGYDVNMHSQLGQFRVRYDLGKGFSVQTFSSAQSTGGDLLYSFER